ncbi:MAG: S8 family serine peptidase, partial [Actinobacteria bacterium]|nr:S8 family serine peptidase [Actinomycetota bacterium]
DYTLDPLAYAAEVAWRKGIFGVVSAGNSGSTLGHLNDPATDPYVLAVGADDAGGTYKTYDDVIPSWSSRGDGIRNPDIVAPGRSIESLRDPDSYIDQTYPGGRINTRFFRGSGTSQAAAVMSGVAAVLISQRPDIRPGQLKKLLMSSATSIPGPDATAIGSGFVNVKSAMNTPTPNYSQSWTTSSGTGSLEAARGSSHVTDGNGSTLSGEQDIFGKAWDGTTWSANAWAGTTWSGGSWNGTTWSGGCWCGSSWAGTTWSGTTWSGTTWSGTTWSGTTWSGTTWSGTTWSGTTWSGTTWSGTTWSEASWS